MLQNSLKKTSQLDLFRSRLENLIDLSHDIAILAGKINWQFMEERFGKYYAPKKGRPGVPIRVMTALHYLKYMNDRSDKEIVRDFLENPYYQYFCGMEHFVHRFPCHPSLMGKFRKKIGEKGAEDLLKQTIDLAMSEKFIDRHEIGQVNVDTFVQEKNITYPTDAKLYHKMRASLVKQAKLDNIELRQTYTFKSKQAFIMKSRHSKGKRFRKAKNQIKTLKNYLGRVVRDINRKTSNFSDKMSYLLKLADRLLKQTKHSKDKLYSLHAPEVLCIAKGKAHKKYEFGNKVSVVTSSKSSWILGLESFQGNHYDGHTLYDSITQMRQNTGSYPDKIYCDKGYRGVGDILFNAQIFIPKRKSKMSKTTKKWLGRRSRVEAVISHLKFDHRMDKNYLLGSHGDKVNAFLAAAAFNLRKIMRNLCFSEYIFQFLMILIGKLKVWKFLNRKASEFPKALIS